MNNPESDKGISSMEDAVQYVYDYLEDNIPDYEWEFPEASFLHFDFNLFYSYLIFSVENFEKPSAIKNQLEATAEQAPGGAKILSFSIAFIFTVIFS